MAYFNLNKTINFKHLQLKNTKELKQSLENKVSLLDAKNMDADFVDELARRELGLVSDDEKCFILKY